MVGGMWISSEVFFLRRWFKFVVAKLRSVLSLKMVGGMWLSFEVGNCMTLRFGILLLMLRRHQNQGVLGPPPSGPHNSSFGSHSSPRGPLQCYNCRGYGHVDAVCPSEATFVPAPSIRLQGITSHHLSHGGTQQWVGDTRANTHITNDLSHISRAREYHGSDNVGVVLGGTGVRVGHSVWDSCLGHPASSTLQFLFSHNNLPFSSSQSSSFSASHVHWARCPLEDKTACAIKQSGAPLHRIKFENTVSAFGTLPGALSPPTLLLDQGCSSLACAWLRHLS
ncbi:hypothetical protein L3X38_004684 [Prunus dulcis]|uniref:CCHC-type domain-containing protein n=1 Tax=Prunus dulcis TaxID=3755 RepID=A0AAD4ZPF4_PRUDU|nr:hypothetical protein L3X38_004684 [Prunus dulcis]